MPENNLPALIAATPEVIQQLIRGARQRLVFVAPGVSIDTARLIAERWQQMRDGAVSVILDVDPSVCRLGYGEIDAIELLERAGASVGGMLHRHPGIRIGVIVSDERALIFAPVPELVEAGPPAAESPNAMLLSAVPAALADALGLGSQGLTTQQVGLDKATRADIDAVREDLQRNPPQRFDVARRLRVFNAAFQFVELEMAGTSIGRRTIRIPSHLIGVGDAVTRQELRTVLKVVPHHSAMSGEELESLRRRLVKRYFRLIPRFGHVILRAEKQIFEADLEILRAEVDRFRENIREKLAAELEMRVDTLATALFPTLRRTPPKEWLLPEGSRRENAMQVCLREDLRQAIGTVDDYLGRMTIRVTYKDVTYESLQDESFLTAAREALPKLPQLHFEVDALAAVDSL